MEGMIRAKTEMRKNEAYVTQKTWVTSHLELGVSLTSLRPRK